MKRLVDLLVGNRELFPDLAAGDEPVRLCIRLAVLAEGELPFSEQFDVARDEHVFAQRGIDRKFLASNMEGGFDAVASARIVFPVQLIEPDRLEILEVDRESRVLVATEVAAEDNLGIAVVKSHGI